MFIWAWPRHRKMVERDVLGLWRAAFGSDTAATIA